MIRDAQGRAFSMRGCPRCAATGPHLPSPDAGAGIFQCFKCHTDFEDHDEPEAAA